MSERKRGYPRGDWQARKEAQELEGLVWKSWRHVLENRLSDLGLTMPNTDKEATLHAWFVLRRRQKLGKISDREFDRRRRLLFEEKEDDFFADPAVDFAIRFITKKLGKPLNK